MTCVKYLKMKGLVLMFWANQILLCFSDVDTTSIKHLKVTCIVNLQSIWLSDLCGNQCPVTVLRPLSYQFLHPQTISGWIIEIIKSMNFTHQAYDYESVDWSCPLKTIFIIEKTRSCWTNESTESRSRIEESRYQAKRLQILFISPWSAKQNTLMNASSIYSLRNRYRVGLTVCRIKYK